MTEGSAAGFVGNCWYSGYDNEALIVTDGIAGAFGAVLHVPGPGLPIRFWSGWRGTA